ncbi:DUF4270 domain-containing protein [Aquimarina mytili]|uniref:DUF4270 domain-containing protein n=1 Tax=Aquimarina mytili TaxID=874423 RepID=A0A936ZVR2_9FLAO|nr:DUF4270 domain-containing protein [Aquimarina mytili]MBL0681901.1 DUF4270 domain-containing protein [Aquimarina mytili]
MKLINVVPKILAIVAIIFTIVSCDDDFNSVGSEIIGDVNFEDKLYIAKPIAFNKKFEKVQTNSLIRSIQGTQIDFHANLLGVYNDPVYGPSTYSVLSQVQPIQFPIAFEDNAVLDSVVISLPYFSNLISTQTNDAGQVTGNTYTLDSIYGNQAIRLSIYQSDYFLRNFDPESDNSQVYYSDDLQGFGSAIEKPENLLQTIDSYIPSNAEIVLDVKDENNNGAVIDSTRVSPRLRVKLSDDVRDKFKTQFLDKSGSTELSNLNNFQNYFRGIYFKAEALTGGAGSLTYFNMREGDVILHYTFDKVDTQDEDEDGNVTEIIREKGTLELGFASTIVNSITTDLNPTIADELRIENQDTINGEANLYLKGGDGSIAVLDLFNRYVETDASGNFVLDENDNPIFIETPSEITDNDKTELDFLRTQDWLVNEASFKVYINQGSVTSGDAEPERIYIFNLETGQPLIDYSSDGTLSNDDPVNSVTNHLERISRGSDERGEFYKIRLTQYVINLLNDEDSDNVKLGLSVSQNVNSILSAFGNTDPSKADELIPTSSIISHEGTILYGNTENVPEAKQLKLDIFYTTSKSN